MKGTFILSIVLIFANLASIGQNLCGTKASYVNTLANTSLDNCTTVTVNLRFHIVRNTDGSGGQANTVIPTIINYLNTSFNPHRIYFNNLGNDEILDNEYANTVA